VGLRKRRSSDGGRGGGDLPLVLQLGPLRRHETLGLAGSQIFAEQRARLPLGADRVPGRSRRRPCAWVGVRHTRLEQGVAVFSDHAGTGNGEGGASDARAEAGEAGEGRGVV
jgi:hypothetical protein